MLTIITALPAETRPLVKHLGLTRYNAPFPLYRNEETAVITAGVGKLAAATAVAWWRGRADPDPAASWLNIGIAGHHCATAGDGYWISRITDAASGRCLFPPQVPVLPLSRHTLTTVDAPEDGYPESDLVDMEASGYYHAATRFCTGELVQCFKIVSDNEEQPASGIKARFVEQLIGDRLGEIQTLATALRELAQAPGPVRTAPDEMIRFTNRWHFTVSQRHQLKRLLERWHALAPREDAWSNKLAALRGPADVLAHLRHRLERCSIRFGPEPS